MTSSARRVDISKSVDGFFLHRAAWSSIFPNRASQFVALAPTLGAAMLDWTQLSRQSDADLGWQDILDLNLACAVGLPSGEAINRASCKETVRSWIGPIRQ